jgi:hypothetical protein
MVWSEFRQRAELWNRLQKQLADPGSWHIVLLRRSSKGSIVVRAVAI